jgi:hypothetical protein
MYVEACFSGILHRLFSPARYLMLILLLLLLLFSSCARLTPNVTLRSGSIPALLVWYHCIAMGTFRVHQFRALVCAVHGGHTLCTLF